MEYKNLSDEQQRFIDLALQGSNILVDACIGSGKTTAIQCFCSMAGRKKRILYLTYNKLLKLDAIERIKTGRTRTRVANYHGFCYVELEKHGFPASKEESVIEYNKKNLPVSRYDILILDEYQDIEREFAELLEHIKAANPGMQIIAVGDMAQKIYDKTRLNAAEFIRQFLGEGSYCRMEFTKCFRLPGPLAERLGTVWHKEIVGVNPDCEVCRMTFREALNYLKSCEPKDILCLGASTGLRNSMLNYLEKECPEKFNKFTVWANINDEGGSSTSPQKNNAIFTTYDGSKGMERDVCVICDWTENYWNMRLNMPQAKYEILRNIFCVAASRGKRKIIFVGSKTEKFLKWSMMERTVKDKDSLDRAVNISGMFHFKYAEDVTDAYNELQIKEISPKSNVIHAPTSEGLIDLSPCIGIYQEVAYFDECSIDEYIANFFEHNPKKTERRLEMNPAWSLDEKILFYVSLETGQKRYIDQVTLPLVKEHILDQISERLASVLPRNAPAQCPCEIEFNCGTESFGAYGFADVIYNNVVYELKFVSELTHTHFLQCAMYMAARGLKKGVLWNVRNNQRFEIRIPDVRTFLDKAVCAVTKGRLRLYTNAPDSLPANILEKTIPEKPAAALPAAEISDSKVLSKEAANKKPSVKKISAKKTVDKKAEQKKTSGKKEASKQQASNYQAQFTEFCDKNKRVCKIAVQMSKKAQKENKAMGPARIEKAFSDMGVNLPFPARTFARYWKEYCENTAKPGKKRRKKTAQN